MSFSLSDLLVCQKKHRWHFLKISRWGDPGWTGSHTLSLIQVCHDFNVTRLFYEANFVNDEIADLSKYPHDPKGTPFLYNLETIEIRMGNGPLPFDIGVLISQSRAKTLMIRPEFRHVGRIEKKIEAAVVALEATYALENNYSVLYIEWKNEVGEFVYPNLRKVEAYVIYERFLKRNQGCYDRCKQAAITLLGLKRRRWKPIDHNLLDLIARIVWETRGMPAWKPR